MDIPAPGRHETDAVNAADLPAGTGDRILIFVPCYNCAEQIGRVVAKVADRAAPPFAELLLVDNRSTDGTAEAACAALQASGLARSSSPLWPVAPRC